MKRLLTFEIFVPRHIEQRLVDLESMKVYKNAEFKIFVQEFQRNLKHIKGLTVTDPKEQFFIDLLQPLIVITSKSLKIYLFDAIKNEYVIEYDWNDNIFSCESPIWRAFKTKFDMSTQDQRQFIGQQVEKHFNIKLINVLISEPNFGRNINY